MSFLDKPFTDRTQTILENTVKSSVYKLFDYEDEEWKTDMVEYVVLLVREECGSLREVLGSLEELIEDEDVRK